MNKKAIIFFAIIFLIIFAFYKYILYKEKINYETIDYNYQSECVREIYNKHSSMFEFDYEGTCKVTVEQIHTMQNEFEFEIEHDECGNMCVGYFVIRRSGNDIDIDSSHICDMIDY